MELFGLLGSGLWYGVFFVIALSIIVAIHEYGHYIVGRWTGIHAEVFSLGFGPVLMSRVDRRGTRWQVAAIPFGGYVKFLGDADASSVRAELPQGLSEAERRHTMAGAPLWARALTVAAGPAANFILTFVVLAGIVFSTGVAKEPPTIGSLAALPQVQPLQPGDVILAMDGKPTPDGSSFSKALTTLPDHAEIAFSIQRGDDKLELMAPNPLPAMVGSVQVKSAAIDAGLREGDVILRAGDRDLVTFADLQDVVFNSEGKPIPLVVWRDGQSFDLDLTPRRRDTPAADGGFETRWMMGLGAGMTFTPATYTPGPLEGMGFAASQSWNMVTTTFSGLWHMATGKISTCNMSGVIGMAEVMGDAAKTGLVSFVSMLAVLSLGVGLLNLFPIPVLDGGHLVFHAWEAVTGKPPSDRALQRLMVVGLTLLLSLMAFALLQDVTCV